MISTNDMPCYKQFNTAIEKRLLSAIPDPLCKFFLILKTKHHPTFIVR